MFTAWKVTLECCWYVTRTLTPWKFHPFLKNNLGCFWPRFPKAKVFVFLGHIWPRLPTVKFFVFWAFSAKDTNGESFWLFFSLFGQGYQYWKFLFFLGHFWPRLPKVKVFVFLGHIWPRLPTVKFFDLWAFSAKDTNGESFFLLSFLVKDANSESFCFLSLFGQGYQWLKLLFFLGHIWPRIPTVKVFDLWAFLAKDTNCESFCFFLVIFVQGYQQWKFWLFLVIFGQGYQQQ